MPVVTRFGAKPCLRSSLRMSLTAADRSRRRWDQDLEDLALMIDRAPQVHMPAGDPDDHFVEMPAITRSRTAPSQSPGDRRSEFEHPTANALVGNVEPALGKQLLNIAIAQAEPEVQPDGMLDHDRGKRCRR